MTTQETVRVSADLIFTTDRGEVPDKDGFERLISDQMAGELDETTGLGCMAVTVIQVGGELESTLRVAIEAADNWCDYLEENGRRGEMPPIEEAISELRRSLTS